ncbi:MAG: hypothetical protein AAGU11_04080 [Syntrophobacteraceae bacterium]
MPTIRNDGQNVYMIQRTDGATIELRPGDTVPTYEVSVLSLPGITVVSPMPYYNPAASRADLASTGEGDDREVEVSPEAASVEIVNSSNSATITVFLDSTANVPGLKIVPQSNRVIDSIKGRVSRLVLQFTGEVTNGECFVTQLK